MKNILGLIFLIQAQTAMAAEPFSPALYKQAEAVLRVASNGKDPACTSDCRPVFRIVKVFKNSPDAQFYPGGRLNVAFAGIMQFLPDGEYTVYIERFTAPSGIHWKLLGNFGGNTEKGISHIKSKCPSGTYPGVSWDFGKCCSKDKGCSQETGRGI